MRRIISLFLEVTLCASVALSTAVAESNLSIVRPETLSTINQKVLFPNDANNFIKEKDRVIFGGKIFPRVEAGIFVNPSIMEDRNPKKTPGGGLSILVRF